VSIEIQRESPYALDEAPDALLGAAMEQAAGLLRAVTILQRWNQSTALTVLQQQDASKETVRLSTLYRGTLAEIDSAFGSAIARKIKTSIESDCELEPRECPPAAQERLFA
jgi:hypothetical protein